MSLAVLMDYAGQVSAQHLAAHGWDADRQREQLREMLIDAVDLYIALRPAMQGSMLRFNKAFATKQLEMDMLALKGKKNSPEYAVCQRSITVHNEILNEDFDALLQSASSTGKVRRADDTEEYYVRLWAVEIVRKLLNREAEAPFGLPVVRELELKRERDDVLARLMEGN